MTTREQVQQLLGQGHTCAEIARLLRMPKSTVSYHKRRIGLPMNTACNRRYDWSEVQAFYDAGYSVSECVLHFGFSRKSWHDAVTRGAVVARPHAMPLTQLLIRGPRSRTNIRRRLIAEGIKDAACEECGISEWRGAPLSLELHHRNGEKHDNRLENLAILCPNCHSQSDTWGGKNAGATVTELRPASTSPDTAA
jgi:5-methylcytosine-specific restriction endonuclease McrA